MKQQDPLIGYTLRRAVIAVCATGFGLLWKQIWPDLLSGPWLIVAIAVMVTVTVVGLIAIDALLDWVYAVSRNLRRWVGFFDRSFIEGAWVDVGLTGSGDSRCAVNFSFIFISYEQGQHKVSGLSWLASSEAALPQWSSEFSSWSRDRLTFWFNEDTGPTHEIASRAVYLVDGRTRLTPSSITGGYKEHKRDVQTRSIRVSQSFLDDFLANNAPGGPASLVSRFGADLSRAALDTTTLGGLSHRQSDLRFQLAKWQLRRVAAQENLDPLNWTAKNRVRFSTDYADWYTAFLNASEQKASEFNLLGGFLKDLLTSGELAGDIKTILDIGPGNGKLSSAALEKLKRTKYHRFRYTAVEPSHVLVAALQDEMSRAHPGLEMRLISQRWSQFIDWRDSSDFDLALAFHSLYFCEKPAEEIAKLMEWVATGRFKHGAILFHTDWEQSPVLRNLYAAAPDSGLCDVLGMTEHAAKHHRLTAVAERPGDLSITFPVLSSAQWKQLQEPNNLANDNDVRTVAQLLAFLIYMKPNDDGSWEAAVNVLRQALSASPSLRLPLRIQYFRKP